MISLLSIASIWVGSSSSIRLTSSIEPSLAASQMLLNISVKCINLTKFVIIIFRLYNGDRRTTRATYI